MRLRVLIDNLPHGDCVGEWGLSLHITYGGKNFLLDTGSTGAFAENAKAMGVSLADVDYGILSHAHYDHANGLDAFFAENQKAKLYLRACCRENCYSQKENGPEYIGIRPGLLDQYPDRLVYVEGAYCLMPGVTLLPHTTPKLEKIGQQAGMYTKEDGNFLPETFAHEQSLVFDTEAGLVILSGCSHVGADNILNEVAAAFPGKRLLALVGGLHLFRSSDDTVRTLAKRIKETGIARIVTGHCTGDRAFELLKEVLGDQIIQMYAGLTLTLP